MTPLLAALSRLCDAVRMATVAASASPASAASRNLRTAVFSDDLTALLRCRAFSFCLLRLIWDLIFATRKPRSGSGLVGGRGRISRRGSPTKSKAGRNTPTRKDIPTCRPRSNRPASPAGAGAASAAGSAGHDRADGHLQGITRIRALALHLRVGLRNGAERAGDPVRGPAAQLLAHLVDPPGRCAGLGSQCRGRLGP